MPFSDYKIGHVDRLNTCTYSPLFVWCGWPTLRLYIPAETEKIKIFLNDFWCFWVTPWHSIFITLTNESRHAYADSFFTMMMNRTNTTFWLFSKLKRRKNNKYKFKNYILVSRGVNFFFNIVAFAWISHVIKMIKDRGDPISI